MSFSQCSSLQQSIVEEFICKLASTLLQKIFQEIGLLESSVVYGLIWNSLKWFLFERMDQLIMEVNNKTKIQFPFISSKNKSFFFVLRQTALMNLGGLSYGLMKWKFKYYI